MHIAWRNSETRAGIKQSMGARNLVVVPARKPMYVAWLAGATALFLLVSQPLLNVLKFQHCTAHKYSL
jgi:hypothetical protein